MTKDRGDWCQMSTGRAVYPLDLHPEDVDSLDIAHSLALQCRFNGHCMRFYSVAEHSLRVLRCVQDETKDLLTHKWALMHDAAEAYMTDIPRPIKRSISGWKNVEEAIEAAISEKFGIPLPIPDIVKHADGVLLATEARDLMAPPPQAWEALPDPVKETVVPLPWYVAEARFLKAMGSLGLAEKTEDSCNFNEPGNQWDFCIVSVCGRPVAIEEFGWNRDALRECESYWIMRKAIPKRWDIDTSHGWGGHGRFGYDVVPAEEIRAQWRR